MNSRKTYNKKSRTKERDVLLRRIARDTVVSFKLEGIVITIEEAYKMAKDADSNLQKETQLA